MYLAVDIGATKTLLAVFSEDGKIAEQLKFPTHETYSGMIKDFGKNIVKLKHQDFSKVVVAVPGRINRDTGIGVAFGNRDWQNVPIASDLEKILNTPVQIENDAKLAALSEADVVKKDFRKVLYVTISTGISAGLIVNGVINPELADSESGQMWFEHQGKLTQWEDFASGRAIVAKYGKRASEITDRDAWKTIAHNIAVGLLELIAVIQPEVVILGGGVGTHFKKFKEPLLAELKKYEVPLVPTPPVIGASRPEEAVVYGCYLLARGKNV